jgi:hypothetical protein
MFKHAKYLHILVPKIEKKKQFSYDIKEREREREGYLVVL